MTVKKIKIKKKAIIILMFVVVFMPLPLSERTLMYVMDFSLDAVINNKPVLTIRGYERFIEDYDIENNGKLYYVNDIGISDDIFLNRNLLKLPENYFPKYEKGEAIVGFTYFDFEGNKKTLLEFNYEYGLLAGQGYDVVIYRTLFFTVPIYIHTWVS